ncbi:MAG: hypothetical protein H6Q59_1274, partial [Firmicutes bacterium]|nr:hypothetical protein [Bacillota bacterium]
IGKLVDYISSFTNIINGIFGSYVSVCVVKYGFSSMLEML